MKRFNRIVFSTVYRSTVEMSNLASVQKLLPVALEAMLLVDNFTAPSRMLHSSTNFVQTCMQNSFNIGNLSSCVRRKSDASNGESSGRYC